MLLSVIVPTWNSVEDLRKFINIWIDSGADATRLVVVDDGSDDETLRLLAGYANVPQLLFARQDNAGPGVARNLGLSAIDTPYVTFADVDDSIQWAALSEVTLQMEASAMVDVVTCPLDDDASSDRGLLCERAKLTSRLHFLRTRMAVWGRIYKTTMLRRLEPLFPATWAGEDVVATLRVASASHAFGYSAISFYRHRRIAESLTQRSDYAEKALESLRIVPELPVERALKAYALAASTKYLVSRGDVGAGARSALMTVRCLR